MRSICSTLSKARHRSPEALERFQGTRREDVEKTQYAANVSALWTENPARYWDMEPIQACFSMLSRAKAVTYENLRMRDPGVRRERAALVRRDGAGRRASTSLLDKPPPPMFTPFRIGQMVVQNRVAVSPMNMYSAEPGGIPGDFHLVHLGRLGDGRRRAGVCRDDGGIRARPHHARLSRHLQRRRRSRRGGGSASSSIARARRSSACSSAIPAARVRPSAAGKAWTIRSTTETGSVFAASPLAFHDFMHVPREITRAEMERVRDDYAQAAHQCRHAPAST